MISNTITVHENKQDNQELLEYVDRSEIRLRLNGGDGLIRSYHENG